MLIFLPVFPDTLVLQIVISKKLYPEKCMLSCFFYRWSYNKNWAVTYIKSFYSTTISVTILVLYFWPVLHFEFLDHSKKDIHTSLISLSSSQFSPRKWIQYILHSLRIQWDFLYIFMPEMLFCLRYLKRIINLLSGIF